jgi:hypothetical protein
MELVTLILGDTSDSSPNVIGFSYGQILLQKFLLQLSPRSDRVQCQGIEPLFRSFLKEERKRRVLRASSVNSVNLMEEQIARNSLRKS